jgi:hypothetical protein
MTQEEKELLLKDLCARLLYGTKVCYRVSDKDKYTTETLSGHMLDYFNENSIIEVKPYLRPMSSMTEYEIQEYAIVWSSRQPYLPTEAMDWLNKKKFDYRGLIPMGLALEAPEEMYNTKTE